KRIDDPVASSEKNQRLPIHDAQRWRRPGAMEDVWRDVFVVTRQQASGALVEDDEAGRIGCADAFVGVVHSSAGVQVEMAAVNKNRTMRGVMRPNAVFLREIERPENVRVERAGLE